MPEVVVWGTGTPRREFLYVDDMAAASILVMELDKAFYVQQTDHIHIYFNEDLVVMSRLKS
jgi:GDP-L-fucose synthase